MLIIWLSLWKCTNKAGKAFEPLWLWLPPVKDLNSDKRDEMQMFAIVCSGMQNICIIWILHIQTSGFVYYGVADLFHTYVNRKWELIPLHAPADFNSSSIKTEKSTKSEIDNVQGTSYMYTDQRLYSRALHNCDYTADDRLSYPDVIL